MADQPPSRRVHVVAFLLDNRGLAFCNACLAFANELSLADAQRVAEHLQPLPEFERLTAGPCSVCDALPRLAHRPRVVPRGGGMVPLDRHSRRRESRGAGGDAYGLAKAREWIDKRF